MKPSNKIYEPTETILLTGAGFTKGFGGYLGSEMWAAILNQPEVQKDHDLRQVMVEQPHLNFEVVYHDVQSSKKYNPEQKSALTQAVGRSYRQMDEILRTSPANNPVAACRGLVRRFSGSRHKRTLGFVFTLNQDLLVERFYVNEDVEKMMAIPALHRPEWFRCDVGPFFGENDGGELKLPDELVVNQEEERLWTKFTSQLMYVKLHGSFGWRSQDGSDVMVIGHEKLGAIRKEPLLKWYLALFEDVLNRGQRKLLAVGYSFRDEHVNDIIVKAIRNSKLQLYILSPKQPIDFRSELFSLPKPRYHVTEIWNSLGGYFPGTVDDFYNEGNSFVPPQARGFLDALGLLNL
jgi:hypothetical protein